jgi:cytochrome c553
MAREPSKPPAEQSPAGGPAEQRAVDQRWRAWAVGIVIVAVSVGGLLGLVIIPAGQRENAGLSMQHAMRRAAGFEPGSPAVRQPRSTATSLPVSQVSWDPEIMRILAGGNTQRGAQLAAETCAACHGSKGLSQTNIPSLAGQSPYAIYKQLHDYRTGARANPQMTPVAKQLRPSELAAVAAYFADASRQYAAIGGRDLVGEPAIEKLAREGDSRRRIPASFACPLNGVGGPIETPVLIGQSQDYLVQQLNNYASGQRKNDVYGRMREISRKLTPKERAELARYLQGTL